MQANSNELWNELQKVLTETVNAQVCINRNVSALNELVNGKDSVKDYAEGYNDGWSDAFEKIIIYLDDSATMSSCGSECHECTIELIRILREMEATIE